MPVPRRPVNTVQKLWGHEVWLVNHESYCGKILYFRAGHSGSLHYHKEKHETFYLKSGDVIVDIDDKCHHLSPGDIIDIPAGTKHRVTALQESEIWEFSTHHDDADTYRIELSR